MGKSDAQRQREYRHRKKIERMKAQVAKNAGENINPQDEADLRMVGEFVNDVMNLPLVQHDGSIESMALTRVQMAAQLAEEANSMLSQVGKKAGNWDGPQFVVMSKGESMDKAREVVRVVHAQLKAHEAEGRTVSAALRAARTIIRGTHLEAVQGLFWKNLFIDMHYGKQAEVWEDEDTTSIPDLLGPPEDA